MVLALTHLGGAYAELGDPERARSLNAEAMALARDSGDVRAAAIIKGNAAVALLDAGEDERAAVLLDEGLEGLRAVGDAYGIAANLLGKAMIAMRRSDVETAVPDLREALSLSGSIGDTQTVAHALPMAAAAVSRRGDSYAAVQLAAACDAVCRAHRFELWSLERDLVDAATHAAQRTLGDTFDEAWAAGADLDVDAVVELAVEALSR